MDVVSVRPIQLVEGVDVVVVAGDVCAGCVTGFSRLRDMLSNVPIVMVAGNHEHYGRCLPDHLAEARGVAASHEITFLEDAVAIVAGVRFIGATLWTDYCLDGASRQAFAMRDAGLGMNDHQRISFGREPWRRFWPEEALATHVISRKYLEAEMAVPTDLPTVVVTPHAPHPGSIAPRYVGDALNPAFCSDLTALIKAGRPKLWIHGHVHSSFDYVVGSTRIICNPHGYGRENPAFDPALVAEVPR